MKKLIFMLLGGFLTLTLTSSSARAEDLSRRFGAGFSDGLINALSLAADDPGEVMALNAFLPEMPFLSGKYHINSKFGAALLFGYNSFNSGKIKITEEVGGVETSEEIGEKHKIGVYGVGVKGFYNLIQRDRINFYITLGIIYKSGSSKWTEEEVIEVDYEVSLSEIDFAPGAGAEFFPVENLGISLEFGFKYRSLSGKLEAKAGEDSHTEEQDFSGFSTTGSIFDVGIHYYF